MRLFMLALRFLTVFPFGRDGEITEADLAGSTYFYPIVGAIMGLSLYLTQWLCRWLWPPLLSAALAVTVWALLSAGLHLDGLMDTFDGLGVRGDRQRRLAVMRDSRVGAFGVQAAVFVIGLKIAAVYALTADANSLPALFLAPVAGRSAMVGLMGLGWYARGGEGLGRVFIDRTDKKQAVFALLAFVLLGFPAAGTAVIWLTGIMLGFFALLRTFFNRNFGGITGDLLGAACELHELVLLLSFSLII